MGRTPLAVLVLAIASQAFAAPPLISVGKGGEVGVNFGGYHASAGLGGLLAGGGAGGLHAEAGTPHGQEARAGLGGSVSEGSSQGGLYAGATAGGGVRAAAGLEGATSGGGSAGAAFSGAQAGGHSASAGLGGETSSAGSGGFSFSAHKSVGYSGGASGGGAVVKEVEVAPVVVEQTIQPAVSHGVAKHKKVTTYEEESVNYVHDAPPPPPPPVIKTVEYHAQAPVHVEKHFEVKTEVQPPVVYKEVYAPGPIVHYKPHHHHHKWVGGYFGAGLGAEAAAVPPPPPTKVVYKEIQAPVVQKRVDIVAESAADANVGVYPIGGAGYSKAVVAHRNPTFFADIFNIPIQTLSAVGKFLGNAAGSTSVSFEKSAYAHADDNEGESSKALASEAGVMIKTPSVTSIIDDVLSIPINTLGAVNKFLENNVPVRKRLVQTQDGDDVPTQIRLKGPARRRAARRPFIIREEPHLVELAEDTHSS